MKWLARLGIVFFYIVGAASVQADDCAKPKTIDDIKALVTNLGYDVSNEDTLLKITVSSNYSYPVYFSIGDQANLVIFTILEDLPEDKIARLPAVSILEFNDTHLDTMTLNKHNGALRFTMQSVIPASAASPQLLRTLIGRLVDDSNGSDTLWNPSKWN